MRAGAPPTGPAHGRTGDPRVDSRPVSHLLRRLTALTALPAGMLLVLLLAAPVLADASLVEANPTTRRSSRHRRPS